MKPWNAATALGYDQYDRERLQMGPVLDITVMDLQEGFFPSPLWQNKSQLNDRRSAKDCLCDHHKIHI